jgi:PAS domain S-box-containing protein
MKYAIRKEYQLKWCVSLFTCHAITHYRSVSGGWKNLYLDCWNMRDPRMKMRNSAEFIIVSCMLAALYFTAKKNFLLFHSVAELFSIVVGYTIFILAWNSRRIMDNDYVLFIGIAYLFISSIDLLHTLAYKGMGVFPGEGSNMATQLWIAGRYLESVTLVSSPLFFFRKLKPIVMLEIYAAVTALIFFSIHIFRIFPTSYADGMGLTPFKIWSELIICGLLAAAALLLFWQRERLSFRVFRLIFLSIIFTIVSELFFTEYVNVYGIFNVLGHIFKVVSFYLIYKALIHVGLSEPYEVLFRNLKQSEEALRESETRYRAIVEDQTELICRWLPDGTITFVNEAYCRYFGMNYNALVGHRFTPLIYEEDREKVNEHLSMVGREFAVGDLEHRVILANGDIRWQKWTSRALFDEGGNIREYQSVGRDVTVRKQAEEAIRESGEKFRTLTKHSPVGICLTDPHGICQLINDRWSDMTGLSPKETYGRSWTHALHPEDLVLVEGRWRDMVQHGGEFSMEYRFLDPRGKVTWVAGNIVAFRNLKGETTGYLGTATDISDRKKIERQLEELNKTLEQRVEERTAVAEERAAQLRAMALELTYSEQRERMRLARILHDHLQQLLVGVKINVNLLGEDTAGKQTRQGLQLVNDLLDRSIEATRSLAVELNPPVLHYGGFLTALQWLSNWMKDTHNFRVAIEADENSEPRDENIRIILFEVVRELLLNAVKHAMVDSALVKVCCLKGGTLKIVVADNGVGFDPETVSVKENTPEGIGLFNIRERLYLVGGKLVIDSAPGKGSRFSLYAPLGTSE